MLGKGKYRARFAVSDADLIAAQRLRHLCFVEAQGGVARLGHLDQDAFDERCKHMLVEDTKSGQLVCCFRLMPLAAGDFIHQSYSAQYYGLEALQGYDAPMVEMGRFCIHPEAKDPDILRVAWGAMTRFVDEQGVEMLFGCSSFHGAEAEAFLDAFDMLADRHIAPNRWLPRVKAPKVFRFAERRRDELDRRKALLRMPPLLKTYLTMGGWVSDHAVVDEDMNTLHVFTGLEIKSIPSARKRALRAVAG